eukprot:CAMPEP_0170479636 /NCGR_PEP_ID=MMETSP0208-20121228/800_1 /TAXON_ID=197538 /ORGANISM="Strombidium inclinatum, Strain S3" /LENGTH=154 /DNA_ID=CAMNT_0010752071 /DNA_START=1 /DNA_END=465 /DNA_ORIENTATION=+
MKYSTLIALAALLGASDAHKLHQRLADEVDDLLAKQDEKDAQEVAQKEFNDAGSKMNKSETCLDSTAAAEDDDYMKTVFDSYSVAGKDKRGNPTGVDILTKEKAWDASRDIIMKWNDLPEMNAKKFLDDKFDKSWKKFDVNNSGFIDTTEAFQF